MHARCLAGPADSTATREFTLPDDAPIELGEESAPEGAPEGATVRVMPDGTNQTVSAEGQPLGDAPGFEPIGPTGTIVRFPHSLHVQYAYL